MAVLKFILVILLCVPLAYLAFMLLSSLLDEALALKGRGSRKR